MTRNIVVVGSVALSAVAAAGRPAQSLVHKEKKGGSRSLFMKWFSMIKEWTGGLYEVRKK
ncbi:MAG: hypothetical protein HXS51_09095 [Theionarchaea archaeon]|nr:hypothetical protein [Theionarchaea archaeon]